MQIRHILINRFGLIWFSGFRGEDLNAIFGAWQPSWLEVGITGHNFGRGSSKNHFSKVWLRLADSPALHSRWPLLLKIGISSNGQNCSILSQNVPKFELYKHNDELFNMCYRIFYEL
jgi:hypothetical protein